MPDSQPHFIIRCWRFAQWPVVWSLAFLAFALGVVGFAHLPRDVPMTWEDDVYNTLQLFVLGVSFEGALNWQLEAARFLVPGVMAYTATQALIVLFQEQLRLMWLRFIVRRHVVVCGLGRMGYKVAARVRQV